jgi:hypothetical protein
MAHLADFLDGVDADAKEAIACAVLTPEDMAPEAVEPAFGHRGQTCCTFGEYYALNSAG